LQTVTDIGQFPRREVDAFLLDVRALSLALSAIANLLELTRHLLDGLCERRQLTGDGRYVLSRSHLRRFYAEKADFRANARERNGVARVEIGGRREGQEVWARWIDGRVQGDREFLKVAGLDPGTRFEDPHAFVELIEQLLDKGSASVVLDVPQRQA
jgi:hypothetical protein